MAEILHMVSIRGTPAQVFAALTEQSGLEGWWTRNVEAQAKAGTVAKFRFGKAGGPDMDRGPHYQQVRALALPGEHLGR